MICVWGLPVIRVKYQAPGKPETIIILLFFFSGNEEVESKHICLKFKLIPFLIY